MVVFSKSLEDNTILVETLQTLKKKESMQNGNMKSLLKSVYDLSFILICWLAMEATSAAALPLLIKRALHLPLTLTPFQHSKHILLQLAKPPSPSSDVIWYVVSTFFAFIELFAFPEFVVFMIKVWKCLDLNI
jgi:hypothetical protein